MNKTMINLNFKYNIINIIKQIYNANTMKKLFNGSINYVVDYNVTKELVDLEEFKTFLVE